MKPLIIGFEASGWLGNGSTFKNKQCHFHGLAGEETTCGKTPSGWKVSNVGNKRKAPGRWNSLGEL